MNIIEALKRLETVEHIYTQTEVAEFLGVTQGTISNYTSGKTIPNLKVASKIYASIKMPIEPFSEEALRKELERESD